MEATPSSNDCTAKAVRNLWLIGPVSKGVTLTENEKLAETDSSNNAWLTNPFGLLSTRAISTS
jgi:hypothetical protein